MLHWHTVASMPSRVFKRIEGNTMVFGFLVTSLVPVKFRNAKKEKEAYYPKGYTSISFTRNAMTAALACGELLSHPGLDKELIDKLLLTGLVDSLTSHHGIISDKNSYEIAEKKLPKLKLSLHNYYEYSKSNNPDFKDIINTVNSECDFEFLKLITNILTKEYVKQEYSQLAS